jgi:hypothetical protein
MGLGLSIKKMQANNQCEEEKKEIASKIGLQEWSVH